MTIQSERKRINRHRPWGEPRVRYLPGLEASGHRGAVSDAETRASRRETNNLLNWIILLLLLLLLCRGI